MPDESFDYVVQPNDYLLKIANQFNFGDVTGILNINPSLADYVNRNFDVLPPGLTLKIPLHKVKTEPTPADQTTNLVTRRKQKYLQILLQDEAGQPLKGWKYKLQVNGNPIPLDTPEEGTLRTSRALPQQINSAELTLTCDNFLGLGAHEEKITLFIGGLDPLVDRVEGRKAVQKILTNLGYYHAPINGELGSDETRAALRAFQESKEIAPWGFADPETCRALVEEQANQIAYRQAPESEEDRDQNPNDPDRPLFLDASVRDSLKAGKPLLQQEFVSTLSEYREPTKFWDMSLYLNQDDRTHFAPEPLRHFPLFPRQAYVAPCDQGDWAKNPNVLRISHREFLFLDTGRWLSDGRDFGLIWGRHAYLCSYHPEGNIALPEMRDGQDADFLRGMQGKARVDNWATASWAPKEEFDWEKIWIVVPDLHLMTAHIGSFWHQKVYDLQAELDLLCFVRDLTGIAALKGKVRFLQIGDSYDLWVGYGIGPEGDVPLYKDTDGQRTILLDNIAPHAERVLTYWIRDIQGYDDPWVFLTLLRRSDPKCADDLDPIRSSVMTLLSNPNPQFGENAIDAEISEAEESVAREMNALLGAEVYARMIVEKEGKRCWINPAEAAFRWLEAEYPSDLTYIYGNHDDYLVLPSVCKEAGLKQRYGMYEHKRVYVEHGQRMEATFATGAWTPLFAMLTGQGFTIPHNYDGDTSGYNVTMALYKSLSKERSTLGKLVHFLTGWIDTIKKPTAELWASVHDQPQYWGELAQVWLGRHASGDLEPPHICVIGHTHQPKLHYIPITTLGGSDKPRLPRPRRVS